MLSSPSDQVHVLGPTDPFRAPHPDVALSELADSQLGVVARRQLSALGLSETMVRDRIKRGLLRRSIAVSTPSVIDGSPRTGMRSRRCWRSALAPS
ncbi:MAG TPA: type IV toxin-antitoxin system AbiEi family antitoxin domain-containing protein [Conexibacter sp.]|nr:type IV toxin-antitoxin system AbiEi family antitoxin domain-containing protein [Conexibacter sp.]